MLGIECSCCQTSKNNLRRFIIVLGDVSYGVLSGAAHFPCSFFERTLLCFLSKLVKTMFNPTWKLISDNHSVELDICLQYVLYYFGKKFDDYWRPHMESIHIHVNMSF